MIAHKRTQKQQQTLRERCITAAKREKYARIIGEGDWVIVPGTYADYLALVVEVISADRATVLLYNDILDEWHKHGKRIEQVEAAVGFEAPELAQTLINTYQTDQARIWAVAS